MEEDSIKSFLESISKKNNVQNHHVQKNKSDRNTFLKKGALSVLMVLVVLLAVYFGKHFYMNLNSRNFDSQTSLLSKVSQLVEVPEEEPRIVTVTNADLLKDKTFFKEAKIGDKLLIFSLHKKAVLYRPSTNKIISIAPLN